MPSDGRSHTEFPASLDSVFKIRMYCVESGDCHSMYATTDLRLLSNFCPVLRGDEQNDSEGTLAASGPVPSGPEEA